VKRQLICGSIAKSCLIVRLVLCLFSLLGVRITISLRRFGTNQNLSGVRFLSLERGRRWPKALFHVLAATIAGFKKRREVWGRFSRFLDVFQQIVNRTQIDV
jgi:hypothetical protein